MNIFSTKFDYARRLATLRQKMAEENVDVILVNLWVNQYYLSGMYQHLPWYPIEVAENTETPLIIFQDRNKEPIFLITYLTGNGTKEGSWVNDVRFVDRAPYGKKHWTNYLADILKENGVDKGIVGIEKDVLVLSTFDRIKVALPKANFKPVDEIFQHMRIVKDADEIKLIKKSVTIAEAGLKAGMAVTKVGVLESEIQKACEIAMKHLGAIREVETMMQTGKRTANHRAFGSNWKKVAANDLAVIDIGCNYQGYGSDLTRTWCVGRPTELQKKATADAIKVRAEAVRMLKPGVVINEIQEAGRISFQNEGYQTEKTYLPSGKTGWAIVTVHGIGLGPFHDPPHVFDRDITLAPSMTVAYTSGVRFANFTIRFEDNFVITPTGADLINQQIPWGL